MGAIVVKSAKAPQQMPNTVLINKRFRIKGFGLYKVKKVRKPINNLLVTIGFLTLYKIKSKVLFCFKLFHEIIYVWNNQFLFLPEYALILIMAFCNAA